MSAGAWEPEKITLTSRIGSDGFLNLKMPPTLNNTECKITVILQPITPMEPKPKTPEELGWTPGFFERTAGAWEGETGYILGHRLPRLDKRRRF